MDFEDRQNFQKACDSIELFWEDIKRDEEKIKNLIGASLDRATDDETLNQLKIIFEMKKSSFVLTLYNVIESTVPKLVHDIIKIIVEFSPSLEFKDFNMEIRKFWIKFQTQRFFEARNKGEKLAELYESLCEPTDWKEIEDARKIKNVLGVSGNLDFRAIEGIFKNFGIEIRYVQERTNQRIESSFPREYKEALKNIRELRNQLAHGNILFFAGSAEKTTVDKLEKCKEATFECLKSLIRETEKYCDELQKDLEKKKKRRLTS